MIYFPPVVVPKRDLSNLSSFDPFHVVTEDGLELMGYFKPPDQALKPILVAFHGNASHPAWMVERFGKLMADGYGVLLAEYRGYGGNPGHPSEEGLYQDARAFLGALKDRRNPIVLYASSLGTGVAVQLATETTVAAVVLETPYDSMVSVAKFHYPYMPFVDFFLQDQFQSIDKISQVKVPILFVVAGRDEVVPLQLAQRLFDAANDPKTMVLLPEAEHNTAYDHDAEIRVYDFLKEVFS